MHIVLEESLNKHISNTEIVFYFHKSLILKTETPLMRLGTIKIKKTSLKLETARKKKRKVKT